MGTTSPLRKPADPANGVGTARESLAELVERSRQKLVELEAALPAIVGDKPDPARKATAELRALLARHAFSQAAFDERVEAQVEQRTSELASLTNFLQTHSEREKALLARELHDALGGILTPAKMDLAWLEANLGDHPEYSERMRRLGTLIDSGIDLKRRIIENLRPSLLDHLGLASALHWYVEETCRSSGIECRLMISERLERLPSDLEIALYRLVQESVGNIVKHARAKVLDLTIERTADGLKLGIADDGMGIADIEAAKRMSHGFSGMMHRVRSMGGSFDVRSEPGKGTRIDVFVPLKAR